MAENPEEACNAEDDTVATGSQTSESMSLAFRPV
jgi:hypothetical protein